MKFLFFLFFISVTLRVGAAKAKIFSSNTETLKSICYLYVYFDAQGKELAGSHNLKCGKYLYSFELSPGKKALKFRVDCETTDVWIDNLPILPVEFENQRACIRVGKRRTIKTDSGFEKGYVGKSGTKLWAKGLFVGAKEVEMNAPGTYRDENGVLHISR